MTFLQAIEANKTRKVRILQSSIGGSGAWFEVNELRNKKIQHISHIYLDAIWEKQEPKSVVFNCEWIVLDYKIMPNIVPNDVINEFKGMTTKVTVEASE